MKISIFSPCLLLLFSLAFYSSYGQFKPHSTFKKKWGKFALVHTMEEMGTDAGMLLTFQHHGMIELVFLDKDLQFSHQVSPDYRPDDPQESIKVDGILNTPDEVYVFMPTEGANDIVSTSLLKINKEDGSHRLLHVYFDPKLKADILRENVRNFRTFQFENRFYKLWIDLKSSDLYVFYVEVGELGRQEFKKISLPIEGIGKRLGKRQVIPTPLITGDHLSLCRISKRGYATTQFYHL